MENNQDYAYTLQTVDVIVRRLAVLLTAPQPAPWDRQLRELYDLALSALLAADHRFIREASGWAMEDWERSTSHALPTLQLDPKQLGSDVIRLFKDQRVPLSSILSVLPLICQHWRESRTGMFEYTNAGYAVAVSFRDKYKELLNAVCQAFPPGTPVNFASPGLPAKHAEASEEVRRLLAVLPTLKDTLNRSGFGQQQGSLVSAVDELARKYRELQAAQEARPTRRLRELWAAFKAQCHACEYKDDKGHNLEMNKTFHDLAAYLDVSETGTARIAREG